ncbi:NAD(P)/FAD-dependent oxidoreductase [Luteolibacter soli]|uniref:FAD-binding domain-containing protein n=1 Tax=Luteolibacter soli TaxID=3135280 RepID=A0ABU9AUK7_9BACT
MSDLVTIAGGGLAGLSLAAGLRLRGIGVTVHEAGSYPRHRVCGEFISGVERATLDGLGIAQDLADALELKSLMWFREGRTIHEGVLPEAAMGISRYRLDRRLKERVVEMGGMVVERSRQVREKSEGLVWAAGRVPRRGSWVGLKAHFHGMSMKADLEMHLGANGYAGLAQVEEGRVNVCGLFRVDRSQAGRGSDLLDGYLRAGGNGVLADRLREATVDAESFCAVAGFEMGRQEVGEGLCVIGDAESMIPPFTGNGMSMAFQAAEVALGPLERWSSGGLAWDGCVAEIREGLRRRFRRRLVAAQTMHPVLLRRGGRDVIESIAAAGLLPFRPLLSLVR